ncbi:autotransporter-associated beta strand repeat-containing protein [Planctomicrobium sp. SH661]|uniref:autotransporter-associated beta strand repeat-containing protein n=1 Tax=Planctomicrobium sp. SH661 TaxID=3448124 RepID=UPI003F5B31B5
MGTAILLGGVVVARAGLPDVNTIYVTSTADTNEEGTLRWAINQANASTGVNDRIVFDLPHGQSKITLSGNLPVITQDEGYQLTIAGRGQTIDGQSEHQVFFVEEGNVVLEGMTVKAGNAVGGSGGNGGSAGGGGLGAGGGLFVNSGADVTVKSVTFVKNEATGGAGGNATLDVSGGGGAGMHGDGGNALAGGAGGGGGFEGDGGLGAGSGGGGGGQYGEGGTGVVAAGGGAGGKQGDGGNGYLGGAGGGGGATSSNNGGNGKVIAGGDGSGGGGKGGGAFGGSSGKNGSANGGGGGGYATGRGGNGGIYGGGGGGGTGGSGGNAGDFGGGGGGTGIGGTGGAGGDFGGGGGSALSTGGAGGFGAGGGGGTLGGGEGGFGGGDGAGGLGQGGDGGDALGGAIFVREGGKLTFSNSNLSGSSTTAGTGGDNLLFGSGEDGSTAGSGMYIMGGKDTEINLNVDRKKYSSIKDDIHTDSQLTKTGKGTLKISGDISGDGSVKVQDKGTLILTGDNSYEGGTEVSEGTLVISSDRNLGSRKGDLELNKGGTLQAADDLWIKRDIELGKGGGEIDTQRNDVLITGEIDGKGGLTKTGKGTLTLTNRDNDYKGDTTVNEGTLAIYSDKALGDRHSDLNLNNGATLQAKDDLWIKRDIELGKGGGTIDTQRNDVLISGEIDGKGGLTKTGKGTLTLTNRDNDYKGDTTVNQGTLAIYSDKALGDRHSDLNLNNGSTLQANDDLWIKRDIELGRGGGKIDTQRNDVLISGEIDGKGGLTKTGKGTLTLTNRDNDYHGDTVVEQGTLAIYSDKALGDRHSDLVLKNGSTLQANDDLWIKRDVELGRGGGEIDTQKNDVLISGEIDGKGGLTKTGKGTLTLTNNKNDYHGDTTVNQGTLAISSDKQLGDRHGDLILNNGSTLQANDDLWIKRDVELGKKGGEIDTQRNDVVISGEIDGKGGLTKTGKGTLTLTNRDNDYKGDTVVNQGTLAIYSDKALGDRHSDLILNNGSTLQANDDLWIKRDIELGKKGGVIDTQRNDVVISGEIDGKGGLTKTGKGTLTLTNRDNDYKGDTTVNQGTLAIYSDKALGDRHSDLNLNNGSTLQANDDLWIKRDIELGRGGGKIDTQRNDVLISGEIDGKGGLTKTGKGTLTLTNNKNDYHGDTVVEQGTLAISSDKQLGDRHSDLVLKNGSTLQANDDLWIKRDVELGRGGGEIDTQRNDVLISGEIDGRGGLTKTGKGTLTLTNRDNDYHGDTVVEQGTLAIYSDKALGDRHSDLVLKNGSTLQANDDLWIKRDVELGRKGGEIDTQRNDVVISGEIDGRGGLTKTGKGTLTLTNRDNDYHGDTVVNQGTLAIYSDKALGDRHSDLILNNGSTLQANDDLWIKRDIELGKKGGVIDTQRNDVVISGEIDGKGGLTKTGKGTLILTNDDNSYRGDTTIKQGTLGVFEDEALGHHSSDINFAGGTLKLFDEFDSSRDFDFARRTKSGIDTNGFDTVFSGDFSGSGDFRKLGEGMLELTGDGSKYKGDIDVKEGELKLNTYTKASVTVEQGASMSGRGTVQNLTVEGVLRPGNSIAGMQVIDSYQQKKIKESNPTGGVLEIEISKDPEEPTDTVSVGGVADLGGTLSIVAGHKKTLFNNGQEFTVLTAGQGFNGSQFEQVIDNLDYYDVVVGYGDGPDCSQFSFITLNQTSADFIKYAKTYNEQQVGKYLDEHFIGSTGDLQDLYQELVLMSDEELTQVMNEMAGQIYGTTAQLAVQNMVQTQLMLRQNIIGSMTNTGNQGYTSLTPQSANEGAGDFIQLASYQDVEDTTYFDFRERYNPGTELRGWATGYGLGGHTEGDGNANSARYGIGGTVFGVDLSRDQQSRVGLYGSYANMNIRVRGVNQNLESNAAQFGTYLYHDGDLFYSLFTGGIGFNDYKSSRSVMGQIASADYNGWQANTWLEEGMKFTNGYATFKPFVALQYIFVGQDPFQETGAGILNLNVDRINTNALRGVLGSALATDYYTQSGRRITPEVRALWLHEFLEPETSLNSNMVGIGGPSFSTRGVNYGRDWAVLGTGFNYEVSSRVSMYANYDLQFNDRQVFNMGSGGFLVVW